MIRHTFPTDTRFRILTAGEDLDGHPFEATAFSISHRYHDGTAVLADQDIRAELVNGVTVEGQVRNGVVAVHATGRRPGLWVLTVRITAPVESKENYWITLVSDD